MIIASQVIVRLHHFLYQQLAAPAIGIEKVDKHILPAIQYFEKIDCAAVAIGSGKIDCLLQWCLGEHYVCG